MADNIDLMGAVVAVAFYLSAILVFLARIFKKPKLERFLGIIEFFMGIPMVYLLITAPQLGRPALYYIQIGLMLAWLVMEALLDYILKIDFRKIKWMTITYVTLFFAGTGGMLGVASMAGQGWIIAAGVMFIVMAILTFAQRSITGR